MLVEELINQIKNLGLAPSTRRELSLFTFSVIAKSYLFFLQKEMGISYRGIAAVGNKDYFHSLINDLEIEKEMENKLTTLNLNLILKRAKDLFSYSQKLREKAMPEVSPEKALDLMVHSYLNYLVSIGIYNCFWRYLGNSIENKLLSEEEIKVISAQRDRVASVYLEMEDELACIAEKVGKKNNFKGALLLSLTVDEIQAGLKKECFILPTEIDLEKRRKGYLYLRSQGEEKIITEKKVISRVEKEFFFRKEKVTLIKGSSAHPGLVRGIVYNHLTNKKKMPNQSILVTSMTHPRDTPLINKCSAIVTDEGGILCHAAIIAREMNKPCIIGTKIGTKVLKEGYFVEVDATKGVVKILKNGPYHRSAQKIVSRK
jgi:phosphohistidine swiveling domain-containing protein